MGDRCVIGVDIGTGSARAGVFDLAGQRKAVATEPIAIWRPHGDWAEQSSTDIWRAVGVVVKTALADGGVSPSDVVGIGFDATCSLVVLDKQGRPLTVSDEGDNDRNVIVWMDHRAIAEAEQINAGNHDVLRYVGGTISPEMETPKLLWLKRHLPETWSRAGKFFDLADYLVWQSTGHDIRSLCTLTCKWTYLGHEKRWDRDYFRAIGIDDIFDGRVGDDVRPIGAPAGTLTPEAAAHLGLPPTVQVGVGIIDAHAGGVGLLGGVRQYGTHDLPALETALALIGGTSSCHMAVSTLPKYVPGVWGPYYSAMVPDMWLTEGGQSATGALIDWSLRSHAAAAVLEADAAAVGETIYQAANRRLAALAEAQGLASESYLARDVHVLDYHLGNRSPIADPRARGVIDGLTLDESRDSLAVQYLATVQSVAYGTRAIVDALNAQGYRIWQIHAVGGGTRNPVWLREHADALGLPIHLPAEPESVLLGSAMLGAAAAGAYRDVPSAMAAMARAGSVIQPDPATASFHAAKYACYREMYGQQVKRREAMRDEFAEAIREGMASADRGELKPAKQVAAEMKAEPRLQG